MPRSVLRVGTRGSALALARAENVRRAISTIITHRNFELVPVMTEGDRIEGELPPELGLFARDLQDALAAGKIDLAVHNAGNLPAFAPEGITLASVPKRDDPRDALVTRTGGAFHTLLPGSTIGVSGAGRSAQLLSLGKGLVPRFLRGHLDNRLRGLSDGEVHALVVPVAALRALGRADRAVETLPISVVLPPPGQGALAVQCRANDKAMRAALAQLEDPDDRRAFEAERSFMLALDDRVEIPVGALAEAGPDRVRCRALIASIDGRRVLTDQIEGDDPEKVGIELADRLRALGADDLLRA